MRYREGLVLILIILEISMSLYIISTETTQTFGCISGFDCHTVLTSPYSTILGIDLGYIGLASFSALLILFILNKKKIIPEKLLLATTYIGVAFALYFLYLQAFIIEAFCSNCLIIDTTMFLIAGISTYNYIENKKRR